MLLEMSIDWDGKPTRLSGKKSLYSVLPDRPDNLANVYIIPPNVVAAGDWDTVFANAQLFATLPKKR